MSAPSLPAKHALHSSFSHPLLRSLSAPSPTRWPAAEALLWPVFVTSGGGGGGVGPPPPDREEIAALPGQARWSASALAAALSACLTGGADEAAAHAAARVVAECLVELLSHAMGAASALIVGPCVAAPLAGALLYIAQSGDAVLGGLALFAMALGMGVPLIAVGVASRSLLPHTGPWMEGVKRFFGVLLLATAIWIASPVLPGLVTMLAWAALLIASSIYLRALDPLPAHASGWHKLWKGVGVITLLAGASLLIGAAAGSRDVLQPLAVLRGGAAAAPVAPAFQPVGNTAELDARLAAATAPVMLDFYADWCVSCKEMERFTFSDPQVAAQMAGMTLLKADVTSNSAEHQALLKRFGLFGPPGILFFDQSGQEIAGTRVIGFVPAGPFSSTLGRANAASGSR
jgi:thiol:disulfide interchange protein DsbD